MARLNIDMPDELKKKFKEYCSFKGLSMNDVILKSIRIKLTHPGYMSRKKR